MRNLVFMLLILFVGRFAIGAPATAEELAALDPHDSVVLDVRDDGRGFPATVCISINEEMSSAAASVSSRGRTIAFRPLSRPTTSWARSWLSQKFGWDICASISPICRFLLA